MPNKVFDALAIQQELNKVEGKAEKSYVDEKVNDINSSLEEKANKTDITTTKTELKKLISDTALATKKALHPVNSIYLSMDSTNPNTLFGFGTWQLIAQGKTLIGVDTSDNDFKTAGKTGGNKTHTNTVEELVPHKHKSMVLGIGNGGYKLEGQAGAGQVGTETNYISETTTVSLDGTKTAQAQSFSIMQPYITVYIWKRTA